MASESFGSGTTSSVRVCLVDDHPHDLGGGNRVTNEASGIAVPRDDVDLLAPELLNHRLNAGALHADACAHRIDVRIPAAYGDLGAGSWLARCGDNANDPLVNLGNLHLEELHEQTHIGAG